MEPELIPAKTIVTKNKSTAWFGTRYTMNIYRGCCHGCIYCDSRSDCYGTADFDTVRVKADALAIIRNDLRAKTQSGVVATGSMSDPYNPLEAETLLTRHALELLSAYGFGAAIATKSALITRDIDILREIRAQAPVLCKVTVTTCDSALAVKLEPRAPAPEQRLEAVARLAQAGIFSGILLMPVLPFLEDDPQDIRRLVRAARDAGARFVYPMFGVTLRANQREYFLQKLETLFPGAGLRARYEHRFGPRYECRCPNWKTLWQCFAAACEETGLLYQMRDIVAASRQGYASGQLSLFALSAAQERLADSSATGPGTAASAQIPPPAAQADAAGTPTGCAAPATPEGGAPAAPADAPRPAGAATARETAPSRTETATE